MSGRHASAHGPARPDGRTALALLVVPLAVALVASVATVALGRGADSSPAPGCPRRRTTAAVAPELASTVARVLRESGCTTVRVAARRAADVAAGLPRGQRPDLWVPDWSGWVGGARARTTARLPVAAGSLASSPVVVVTGDGSRPVSWTTVLGGDAYLTGDPLTSTASAVPLYGSIAEGASGGRPPRAVAASWVEPAQGLAGRRDIPDDAARLRRAVERSGSTVVSEQRLLAVSPTGVTASVPRDGTLWLDYPLVVTARPGSRHAAYDAARWLRARARGVAWRHALARAGFRAPDRTPLPGRGVGRVRRTLHVTPSVVETARHGFARLTRPTRALAVVDISGSMGVAAGHSTRMQLTVGAARGGIALFPDSASIGLWTFARHLDGRRDHRQLVPIRPLGAEASGGRSHAQVLARVLTRLRARPHAGTGLYDTVLAAYRRVQRGYDPRAVNSVLVLTDGRNQDPGSIGLRALLRRLRAAADPDRPVTVVAIGISAQADAAALRRIAAATGGASFVARDSSDVGRVFRRAMADRLR